jgi:hypothetical protein
MACTRLLRFEDRGLFPIDAVMGRIEVKRTLEKKQLKRDFDRIVRFRRAPTLLQLGKGRCAPRGHLVGLETKATGREVAEWFVEE